MSRQTRSLKSFIQDESGTDLIEYAMAAGIVGAGAVVSLRATNPNFDQALSSIASFVTSHL